MYQKLLLFYFTGTGNALAASNWIAAVAKKQNIPVVVKKITPSLIVPKEEINQETLIGFCYPTHGFNAPPVVVDFILRFPKMKNQVFVLNTRAGMKLYKLFLPGLSGLAQLLPALILRCKGLKTIGFQPMDLPSNWISIHPGLRGKVVDSIFERCERKTTRFAQKIINGKKVKQGWLSFPIDVLISPISIAYYFFGRFALAKTFVADNHCNACGLCVKECPVKAIQLKNNRPFWTTKCESCMHCMNSCPKRAIQTPHLFLVVLWWLIFAVFPVFLIHLFSKSTPVIHEYFTLFFYLFLFITGLPVVLFSYRILHFLMKFRFFNALFTYSSFTKYKFWRRYFAPKKYL